MNNDSSAFNIWAKDEGYWIEDSISTFSQVTDAKVAFDAEDYLNSFLTGGHATYEPLVPALGGIPFTLNSHIDTLLSELHNAGIKPLFIFPGGRAMSRDRLTTSRDSQHAVTILNQAWNIYNSGRGEEAVKEFGKACKVYFCQRRSGLTLTFFRHVPSRSHPAPPVLLPP
jgi:hypothetical protein